MASQLACPHTLTVLNFHVFCLLYPLPILHAYLILGHDWVNRVTVSRGMFSFLLFLPVDHYVQCLKSLSVVDLLCLRVKEVVSYYIPRHTNIFIQLVTRVHGVFTGYTLLDFVNGKWEDNPMERQQCYPLEMAMDNLTVQEAITFFVDMFDNDIRISIDNNIDPLMGSTCSQIVTIGNEDATTDIPLNYQVLTNYSYNCLTSSLKYM